MFGERLKSLRNELNLTQLDLSKLLKVSPSTIGMYEQNRRDPDSKTIKFLAEYFNVSTDYLLGKSNIKDSADKIIKNANDNEYTLALHNSDGYDADLPPEAREELKEYIEFLKHKYSKKD
ncbi:helix-turn-helix domain-containing protein [Clostridium intestinale]|uniref:DNA-binding protein n=1 Tax=Clostridium intestinale URNW TaxID=1294142 RepID=U2NLZ9_9CLOT|nr:helix-turn-helix transcriptional regulator [Clostridium intestinale]ERK30173.1 DNA-binding protein [Clostridium intestinale URNW]